MNPFINYEPLYEFIREKNAHSTWYSRHREESHRKRAVWAMMNKEKIHKKSKKRQRMLKNHQLVPHTRIRFGTTYIDMGPSSM